jgi:Ankyrin repeats (3 copies)
VSDRLRTATASQAAASGRRYYVVTAGVAAAGCDAIDTAVAVARQYGEGTYIVDTQAAPYFPMVQQIDNGAPVYLEYGAWPASASPHRDLIEAAKKGCPAVVAAFLAKGADVNARDERGRTALHWAVARRVPECVAQLIAAGAGLDVADRDGKTALQLAQAKNLAEIAALLLQAGAREVRERV